LFLARLFDISLSVLAGVQAFALAKNHASAVCSAAQIALDKSVGADILDLFVFFFFIFSRGNARFDRVING
jgi:hypothetical protein